MTSKPDTPSAEADNKSRREFLRTTGIVAGGVILTQPLSGSTAKAAQGAGPIPLTTRLADFPRLAPEEKKSSQPEPPSSPKPT